MIDMMISCCAWLVSVDAHIICSHFLKLTVSQCYVVVLLACLIINKQRVLDILLTAGIVPGGTRNSS